MDKRPDPKNEKDLLYLMLMIRRFEERAAQQYQMGGKIGGFCHLYIGQEAVAVGSFAATRQDDYFITAYRDHAHALVKGTSANACMAELFGKATGCSRGMGGSMHYFDRENFMYGGHAIVGSHIPVAVGIAFASKYKREDRVTLCYFGDGAINIGAFHEGLNAAGLWKLPIVFICENNQFSMGTSLQRSNPLSEIVNRAKGYDMKHAVLDGMDVRSMREGLQQIVADIRKNPQPYFVEVRTYRYRGHSMSDPGHYRTKDELDKYKGMDPILKLKTQLELEGKLTEKEYEAIDARAKQVALDAVAFAEESPEPGLEELHNYTFVD